MATPESPSSGARAANRRRVDQLDPRYVGTQRAKQGLPPELPQSPEERRPTNTPPPGSPGPRAPQPARRLLPRVGGGVAETGAGLVLGMAAYAMLLAAIEYGPTGPLLWLRAKFLNEPAGPPQSSSGSFPMPAGLGGLQGPPFPYGGVY